MKEEQLQWVAIVAIGIIAVVAYMKSSLGNSDMILPPPPLPNGSLPIEGAPLPDSSLPNQETLPQVPRAILQE